MKLAPIITQLKAQVSSLQNRVGGGADVGEARNMARALPAAAVIPLTESGSDNQFATGMVSQRLTWQFGIVLAVKNVSDQTGGAAADDLETLRDSVKLAIVGWKHPDADRAAIFVRGNLISFDNATLWWLDRYQIQSHYRKI